MLCIILYRAQNRHALLMIAPEYGALMVKRNAPRWLRMLRCYGYIAPVNAAEINPG